MDIAVMFVHSRISCLSHCEASFDTNTFKIDATSVSEILYYIHKKGIEGFLWSSPHGHGERNVDSIVWQKYFRILDEPPSCKDIILTFSTL